MSNQDKATLIHSNLRMTEPSRKWKSSKLKKVKMMAWSIKLRGLLESIILKVELILKESLNQGRLQASFHLSGVI
jgi:hypothetical protein